MVTEKKKQISLLVYSPDRCSSQELAKSKPETRAFPLDPPHGCQGPKHLDHILLLPQVKYLGNWIKNGTGADVGNQGCYGVPASQFNPLCYFSSSDSYILWG